ncbi:MAG: hypothetical protein ACK5KO_04075 [Arachnia sp.]
MSSGAHQARSQMMRRHRILVLVIAAVVLLGLVLLIWRFVQPSDEPAASDPVASGGGVTVIAATSAQETPTHTPSPSPSLTLPSVAMTLGTDTLSVGDVDVVMPGGYALTSMQIDDQDRRWYEMTSDDTANTFTLIVDATPITSAADTCEDYARAATADLRDSQTTPAETLGSGQVDAVSCTATGTGDADSLDILWWVYGSPDDQALILESRVPASDIESQGGNIQNMREYVSCEVGYALDVTLTGCGP